MYVLLLLMALRGNGYTALTSEKLQFAKLEDCKQAKFAVDRIRVDGVYLKTTDCVYVKGASK